MHRHIGIGTVGRATRGVGLAMLLMALLMSCSEPGEDAKGTNTLTLERARITEGLLISLAQNSVLYFNPSSVVPVSSGGGRSRVASMGVVHLRSALGVSPDPVDEPLDGAGAAQAATADCVRTSGNEADTDKDGLPANVTYRLQDCRLSDGSRISGSVEIRDKDDRNARSGYSADLDLSYSSPNGRADIDMSITINPETGGGFSASIRSSASFVIDIGETEGKLLGTIVYTPTAAEVWDEGTITGDLDYDFAWDYDCSRAPSGVNTNECREALSAIGGKTGSMSLSFHYLNLGYSTTCSTGIVSGAVEARDDSENKVRVTYSGCGITETTYNGEEVE